MEGIPDVLNAILEHLTRLNRPVVGRLRPGLGKEELGRQLAALPIQLPRELEEMYLWRNGTDVQRGQVLDDVHFFPGFYWLSLEDATATYQAIHVDERWDRSWFPVFANGGGDFYAIVCDSPRSLSGEIVGFVLGEVEQPAEYESLVAMLRTLNACFEEGAFVVSSVGYLEADDLHHADIARRFNSALPIHRRGEE